MLHKSWMPLALLLLVTAAIAIALPSRGFPGFHDDPGNTCIGNDDPFCGEDDEAGQSCFRCKPVLRNGQPDFDCVSGSAGAECTVAHTGTDVTCETPVPCN